MEKQIRKPFVATKDALSESAYDPIKGEAYFVSYAGEAYEEEYLDTANGKIYPLDGRSDLVSKGVVLLPSAAEEYGTDTELVEAIQAFIHKRVDISPAFETIAARYVLLTWLHDRLNELPYLRARGDYGSGKTRFLQIVGSICYRPIFTAGATTTSPIFRIVDQLRGTLVLDEADFNNSDERSDIVKILNTGYQKGVPVLRSEGKGVFEVKSYDVFGPKIVATRQNFNDQALESRFLIEDMGRVKLRDDIPIRLDDSFRDEALSLRNRLLMWRFRNFRRPLVFDDTRIDGLHPRMQQIIQPLLAVMPAEDMKQTLISHARRYNEELIADRGLSWEADIILAILQIQLRENCDEISYKDIAQHVNNGHDDLHEDHITAKKTGWYLRARLQIKGRRTRTGYMLSFSKSESRIRFWKERFGITDADITGEEVNDVNIENEQKALLRDNDEVIAESNPF